MRRHARALARASLLELSVPLGVMDCRVKPGNDVQVEFDADYFFAGADGLSVEGSGAAGG